MLLNHYTTPSQTTKEKKILHMQGKGRRVKKLLLKKISCDRVCPHTYYALHITSSV